MKRNILLNIIFIAIFLVSLILSFMIDFFFFIPIICFLPFSFRTRYRNKINIEKETTENSSFQNFKGSEVIYCSSCGGEITKSIAKFCYHCGEKLNSI